MSKNQGYSYHYEVALISTIQKISILLTRYDTVPCLGMWITWLLEDEI